MRFQPSTRANTLAFPRSLFLSGLYVVSQDRGRPRPHPEYHHHSFDHAPTAPDLDLETNRQKSPRLCASAGDTVTEEKTA